MLLRHWWRTTSVTSRVHAAHHRPSLLSVLLLLLLSSPPSVFASVHTRREIKTKFRFSPPTKRGFLGVSFLPTSFVLETTFSSTSCFLRQSLVSPWYFCSEQLYFDERESCRSSFYRDTFDADKQAWLVHRSDIDPLLAGLFRFKGLEKTGNSDVTRPRWRKLPESF